MRLAHKRQLLRPNAFCPCQKTPHDRPCHGQSCAAFVPFATLGACPCRAQTIALFERCGLGILGLDVLKRVFQRLFLNL